MRFVGIDPGKSGALAMIDDNREIRVVRNFDLDGYGQDLRAHILFDAVFHQDSFKYKILIESVHAMPGQGVTSMFHFGENFGQICGLLKGMNLEFDVVTPMQWKKSMGVTADKQSSINKALELFEDPPLLRTSRSRVPDNNRAEALLIAEYAREHFKA